MRGFDQVSGPVGLTSDGAGGLYMAGVGQRTGGESALLYARWDGRAWGENETFGLGQNARRAMRRVRCLFQQQDDWVWSSVN